MGRSVAERWTSILAEALGEISFGISNVATTGVASGFCAETATGMPGAAVCEGAAGAGVGEDGADGHPEAEEPEERFEVEQVGVVAGELGD